MPIAPINRRNLTLKTSAIASVGKRVAPKPHKKVLGRVSGSWFGAWPPAIDTDRLVLAPPPNLAGEEKEEKEEEAQ